MTGVVKRVVLEAAGWLLLILGIAAIFLPGPGLLAIFAGLYLLSRQYEWADRRVEPVKLRALLGAAEGVENWLRVCLSLLGVAGLVGFGILWLVSPDVPDWWPIADRWWLPGGIWPAVTLILSAAIALALVVYSYRRFHGKPEAVVALREAIGKADHDAHRDRDDEGQSEAGTRVS